MARTPASLMAGPGRPMTDTASMTSEIRVRTSTAARRPGKSIKKGTASMINAGVRTRAARGAARSKGSPARRVTNHVVAHQTPRNPSGATHHAEASAGAKREGTAIGTNHPKTQPARATIAAGSRPPAPNNCLPRAAPARSAREPRRGQASKAALATTTVAGVAMNVGTTRLPKSNPTPRPAKQGRYADAATFSATSPSSARRRAIDRPENSHAAAQAIAVAATRRTIRA